MTSQKVFHTARGQRGERAQSVTASELYPCTYLFSLRNLLQKRSQIGFIQFNRVPTTAWVCQRAFY